MENWVHQHILSYQVSISALRRTLERRFGDNYRVKIKFPNQVVVTVPHPLSKEELKDIEHRSIPAFYRRQTFIFGARPTPAHQQEPVSHSLLPAHRSTEDLPVTQPRDPAASSAVGSIVDEDNDKEALETRDTGEVPMFDVASQQITLVDIGTGLKCGRRGIVKVEQPVTCKRKHKIQSSLYSVLLGKGATSSVFGVTGRILWSVDRSSQLKSEAAVQKFAVKRLDKHTFTARFWAEYNSLKLLKSLNHPHIVETLSVFRHEGNEHQYLNFLFPMALDDLKQLFRGMYGGTFGTQESARESLWDQFAGLASAVAYLHDSIQMAHRDIKPSNILIYEEPSSEGSLILKLTDFGLAIDLSNALTWETGPLAQQSAWPYDSPEIRRTPPNDESNTSSAEGFDIPSPTELLANDIWKLGCVFTEMVAFLVCGGSVGVTNFRDFITTTEDKISSDMFNDTRFDDGEKVKDQVLDWIDQMSRKDMRAECLQPLLGEMLAKSAQRPTIARVCDALVQVDFPNINFDDGLRLVRFTPANRMSPLTQIETLRLGFQKWIGRTVDWGSSPSPRPRLSPDQFLMTWKWQGSDLCMSLSQDELDRYKPMCLPRTTRNTPILPVVNQPAGSSTQRSTNIPLNNISQSGSTNSQHAPGNITLGGTVQSSTAQQSSGLSRDMYWCIEKIFTEPTENHLFSILKSEDLEDDKDLYDRVNKAIRSARCWVWWLFSWKRCTEVDFIEFCVVRRGGSEVDPMKSGILPPLTTRGPITTQSYTHAVPLPHDVQMRAAGKQMVLGLMYPSKGRGEKTIISMLPKKLNPPPLRKEMGQVGWGLHAKMGFSQWRFLYWLFFCFVLNAIFVALWLVYINSTDLQNAFVPAVISTAALTFALAVIQISEMRVDK